MMPTAPGDDHRWVHLSDSPQLVEILAGPGDASLMRVRLPHHTTSVAVGRAIVASLLEQRGVPSEHRADIVLAVSEASTNAIEHGRGPHLEITLEIDDEVCVVTVGNELPSVVPDDQRRIGGPSPPGRAPEAPPAMPATTSVRGRGVALMEMVMDEVSFEVLRDRCVVAMCRRFGGASPQRPSRSLA
jgi:serine/threonine-protein kinase RsbW